MLCCWQYVTKLMNFGTSISQCSGGNNTVQYSKDLFPITGPYLYVLLLIGSLMWYLLQRLSFIVWCVLMLAVCVPKLFTIQYLSVLFYIELYVNLPSFSQSSRNKLNLEMLGLLYRLNDRDIEWCGVIPTE